MSICIRTFPNGKTLDITHGKVSMVKLQSSYVGDTDATNDYTLPFNVPDVPQNKAHIASLRKCETDTLQCELDSNGVPITEGFLKFLNQTTGEGDSDVQIVGEHYYWRTALDGKTFCDLLQADYQESNHPYTEEHQEASMLWNGDSGKLYTYPTIKYGNRIVPKPAYFAKEHLIRAFNSIGYDLTYKGAEALSIPVRDFIVPFYSGVVMSEYQNILGRGRSSQNIGGGQTIEQSERISFFPNPVADIEEIPIGYADRTDLLLNEQGQLCAITCGEYEVSVTVSLKLYGRRGGATNPTTTNTTVSQNFTTTQKMCCECVNVSLSYDFTGPVADTNNNYLSVIINGESHRIFTESEFLLSKGWDYYYNDGSGDDGIINLQPKLTVSATLQTKEEQGVCEGDTVHMDINCLQLPVLDLVRFLQDAGFNFITEGRKVCMIHRKDRYGTDQVLKQRAESWTNRIDVATLKERPIRSSYSRNLVYQYSNDSDTALEDYEQKFGKELGKGTYTINDQAVKEGETVMNSSNVFSATAMVEANEQGVLIPQIGDEVNDETTPRILVYHGLNGEITYTDIDSDGLVTGNVTKLFGESYFYKEEVYSLDFSDTHGMGLISRYLWRYLGVIACGMEIEGSVIIDDVLFVALDFDRAKVFVSRDMMNTPQLGYHFLIELSYDLGGETSATFKAWQV